MVVKSIVVIASAFSALVLMPHVSSAEQMFQGVHSPSYGEAKVILASSTKRSHHPVSPSPDDELIGSADGNSDKLIGRVEDHRDRNSGNDNTRQVLGAILGAVVGGGNYQQPVYQQPVYQQPTYGQQAAYGNCPVDYYGRPDQRCIAYKRQMLLQAQQASQETEQTFQCRVPGGLFVISRTWRQGCVPVMASTYGYDNQ